MISYFCLLRLELKANCHCHIWSKFPLVLGPNFCLLDGKCFNCWARHATSAPSPGLKWILWGGLLAQSLFLVTESSECSLSIVDKTKAETPGYEILSLRAVLVSYIRGSPISGTFRIRSTFNKQSMWFHSWLLGQCVWDVWGLEICIFTELPRWLDQVVRNAFFGKAGLGLSLDKQNHRIQFLSSVSMLILLRMPNDHPLHLHVSIFIEIFKNYLHNWFVRSAGIKPRVLHMLSILRAVLHTHTPAL